MFTSRLFSGVATRSIAVGVAGALCLAMAACQGRVKIEPAPHLADELKVKSINRGRPVRIAIVISPERPAVFGDPDSEKNLEDRFFDDLCHDRDAWDPSRTSILAIFTYDPAKREDERIADLDGDRDRILGGIDRKEAKEYRHAAIFWWYEPDGKRGVSESEAGTGLDEGFAMELLASEATVEWGASGANGLGGLEDAAAGIGDAVKGVFEGLGDLLGGLGG